jgi:death-on-curing protein
MSEPEEPAWLTHDQIIAVHSRQLRRFGGAPGRRGEAMLRSALERPTSKWHDEQAGLVALAAAHAFDLANKRAFVDGNRRIAFMAMMVFLRKNGIRFAPDQAQATAMILALAAGEVGEDGLARWITDNLPKA